MVSTRYAVDRPSEPPADAKPGARHAAAPPKPATAPRRTSRLARRLSTVRASGLATGLAIIVIGTLVALSSISITSTYSTLSDAAKARLVDDSTLVGLFIATQLALEGAQLESVYAARPEVVAAMAGGDHTKFDKPVLAAAARDVRLITFTSRTVFVTDAAGRYWGDADPASGPAQPGADFSSTDWYRSVKATSKPYVSAGFISRLPAPKIEVAIAAPILADGRNAPKGTLLGMIVGFYPQGTPDAVFVGYPGTKPFDIQVTDQNGNIVGSSFGTPSKLVHDSSTGVAIALKGGFHVDREKIAGQDSFAAYTPVPLIGWTLRSSVRASVSLSDANRLLVKVLIITGVLVAMMGVVKIMLYLLVRELQSARGELAEANANLEGRVAARTAELEASNRDLESFSFSVSHDLRAPLRSIDGFSRMLAEESGDALPPSSKRLLNKITSATQQMGVLIDELLGFSRLRHVEMHKDRVETARLVRRVITELKADNADRNIELTVGDLPDCHADEARLDQVFKNVLGNAVKFTAPRPVAHIEVGSTPSDEPGMVTYFVKDDGVGFDMRYAGQLFEPFQRLHSAAEFTGTGVGLALVKRIIERHGGRVWAEGAPDHGATIHFTLEREHDVHSAD